MKHADLRLGLVLAHGHQRLLELVPVDGAAVIDVDLVETRTHLQIVLGALPRPVRLPELGAVLSEGSRSRGLGNEGCGHRASLVLDVRAIRALDLADVRLRRRTLVRWLALTTHAPQRLGGRGVPAVGDRASGCCIFASEVLPRM